MQHTKCMSKLMKGDFMPGEAYQKCKIKIQHQYKNNLIL